MKRIDPCAVFCCLLVIWGLFLALIVGGCGGAQRRDCAANRVGGGDGEKCERRP